MTGIWSSVPWLSSNLLNLIFIAVCTLIVSSFLERRITLQQLDERVKELTQAGIRLESRRESKVGFEERLEHAQYVDILGFSLVAVANSYGGFLHTRAVAGCKFRVLLSDPTTSAVSSVAGDQREIIRKQDIERSVAKLEPSLETGNVKLGYIPIAPPFSLLIVDPAQPCGEVQVELFVYRRPSGERPHFILNQARDKRWYDFFVEQFEQLWNDARPHDVSGGRHG
jgi:hypothetical protein